MSKLEEKREDAPGQNKEFEIFVNTRIKHFSGKEIQFRQVVGLAYENAVFNDQVVYTVTYSKGEEKKPKGTMVDGQSVHLKDKMVFDVERTDRS